MATPRALILRAAGTNCDQETAHAFEMGGARADVLPLQPFLERPSLLADYQILAIPGGFSYGDDIAAGRVFGLRLAHRAGEQILDLVQRGGAVLGICNGFQVLVQMGLLPGLAEPLGQVEVTLTDNDRPIYQDRWVNLEVTTDRCVFLKKGERFSIPMAHAEGKLVPRDDATLHSLQDGQFIAVRYVGPNGEAQPAYPHNPNGSVDAIAGLTDRTGRVLGLMPHPERFLFPFQHPTWTRDGLTDTPEGRQIFHNAVQALR